MEKLGYCKKNAEEDYSKTPISVLRYISEMEKYIMFDTKGITWRVDHDYGMDEALLTGVYRDTVFSEGFSTTSWFSLGLMFAKWKIKRRFKIIYKEKSNETIR